MCLLYGVNLEYRVNECRSAEASAATGRHHKWFLDFLPNLAGLRQIEIMICFVSDKPRLIDWKSRRSSGASKHGNTGNGNRMKIFGGESEECHSII